jgi:hypothetical protein
VVERRARRWVGHAPERGPPFPLHRRQVGQAGLVGRGVAAPGEHRAYQVPLPGEGVAGRRQLGDRAGLRRQVRIAELAGQRLAHLEHRRGDAPVGLVDGTGAGCGQVLQLGIRGGVDTPERSGHGERGIAGVPVPT